MIKKKNTAKTKRGGTPKTTKSAKVVSKPRSKAVVRKTPLSTGGVMVRKKVQTAEGWKRAMAKIRQKTKGK